MTDPTATTRDHAPAPIGGLNSLDSVELPQSSQRLLDAALRCNLGPAVWRDRKAVEARKLLALAELAGPERMQVRVLDLHAELRTEVRLHVPVALQPGEDDTLRFADEAVLGIIYPHLILSAPLPGFSLVTLLQPAEGAFYPNCGTATGQRLCLGAQIPTSTPLTEIVLLSWGLLSGQNVMLNPDDHAGVMNGEAAFWFQTHTNALPLTREPFLTPRKETGHGAG